MPHYFLNHLGRFCRIMIGLSLNLLLAVSANGQNKLVDDLLKESTTLLGTKPNDALELAFKGVQVSLEHGSPSDLALCYKNIGTAYFYLGQYDSTKMYWAKSKVLLLPIGGALLGDAYNNMGIIYQRTGPVDSSYFFHSKALEIRSQNNDTLGVANSNFNLGALQRGFGNFAAALEYNFRALKIYELINNKDKIGEVFNSIGLVYLSINDYSTALSYFQKSLDIKMQGASARSIGNTMNSMASAYELLNDLDHAEEYYLQAKNVFTQLHDPTMLAGITSNLGVLAKNREEFEKAVIFYKEATDNFEVIRDAVGIGTAQSNLGSVYYLQGEYVLSRDAFLYSNTYAKEAQSVPLEMNIAKGLSKTYIALGDYKQALQYNERYVELNDSLFNQSTAEKIAELQEGYEAEKKMRQIKELQNMALLREKEVRQKQFVIWLISGGGVLSILLLLLFINRIKIKRRVLELEKERYQLKTDLQQKELDLKSRELTGFAGQALQKGKVFQEILESLEKLNPDSNEVILQVEEVKRTIKNASNDQEDWDKFKLHFENVHPGFFAMLQRDFSNLTANDLKHCAYVKMNLSVKEVAEIMNITPKSAKMNRYRLKKKLDLSEEFSLKEFLLDY